MKTQVSCRITLIVALLCVMGSTAVADFCGLAVNDRVELVVDNPDDNPVLFSGARGTVVCLAKDGSTIPVLVRWDQFTGGHEDVRWCTSDSVGSCATLACWYMKCHEIRSLPEGLDLFDVGEQHRYFYPQVVLAGQPSQPFEVGMAVENGGPGEPAHAIYVDVYASQDTVITESDHYLGSTNFWVSAYGSLNAKVRKDFPTTIPPGLYYIGWIIDPADRISDEFDETNNVAYVTSYRLTVLGDPNEPSLTVSAAAGGHITVPGEGVFTYSTTVDVGVEASADPNCTFLCWTGTAVDAGKLTDVKAAQTHVTVDAPYTLEAVFDGSHLLVDDFENSESRDHPLNQTWIDGLGHPWGNGTGSVIGYAEAPSPEHATVHGGSDAMFFSYRNDLSPYYSETERRWGTLQNWAMTGADALSIWYRGAAGNDVAPLYVALEDSHDALGVVEHADPAAVKTNEWRNWIVPLADFEGQGFMLSRIVKMCLGVGDRDEPRPGGAGILYFDDITLVYAGVRLMGTASY